MDKNARLKEIDRYTRMIEKEMGRAVRPYREDGYVNAINKYGTTKDSYEHYHFQAEPYVEDGRLCEVYEGNGLFAKIIDMPAEEAVKHGFKLDGVSDKELVNFYEEALDELDWEETAMTAIKWARLFGGSIVVMLINDGHGLEEPLDWRHIRSIDDLRVYDRSIIQPDYNSIFSYDPVDPFRTRGSRLGMPEFYDVTSRYGSFRVHESRCLTFQNGVLPEYTHNSVYQIWGIPEYIRIKRALRDAELAHGLAPKLLERSVQPVYKMLGLSNELATEDGEDLLMKRLEAIDFARGVMNTMVVDAEAEDYDFKSFSFSGVNDVLASSCNMLSAVTNIPQTLLFGQPVGGLSTTDDTAMENYYNYVERIQKKMVRSNLRYLLNVVFQAGLRTKEVDEVPKLSVVFNPLWSLNDVEQADLDQKKATTQQIKATTATTLIQAEVLDPSEVRKSLADAEEFDIENMLDEYDEEDLFAGQEIDPDTGLPVPQPEVPAPGGAEVANAEHEQNPGTEGSAPAAAPAATKLPQDMSQEELQNSDKLATQAETDAEDTTTPPNERCGSAAVIVVKDGNVLVGRRVEGIGSGLICGPGGHIEDGETPEQAAIRETQEEFGITPKDMIRLGYGPKEPETGLRPMVYLATDYEGELECKDGEMAAPVFLSMEDIEKMRPSLFPPFADGLALFLNELSGAEANEKNADKSENILDLSAKSDTIKSQEKPDNEDADQDVEWVTMNGAPVPLKDNGEVAEGGQKNLQGEKFTDANSEKRNNAKLQKVQAKFKRVNGSMTIDKHVSAKWGDKYVQIKAGSVITDIEDFAGKNARKPLRVADKLAKQYGGKPEDWVHSTGKGSVTFKGRKFNAEIHWFENPEIGQTGIKVKNEL